MRVLLADDQGIVRRGMRALLETEPSVDIVADTFIDRAGNDPLADGTGERADSVGQRPRDRLRDRAVVFLGIRVAPAAERR